MDRVPTIDVGVLGVALSDPEVTAVFPEMSSTILPHGQEIRFYRGDSLDIAVQLQNDGDPPDPIDLGGAVLRFAAKQGHGGVPTSLRNRVILGNEAALVVKTSADPTQVELVNASRGQAIVHLYPEDTTDLPTVPAVWDMEVTRPRSKMELPTGHLMFAGGSDVVLSLTTEVDWMQLGVRPGDLLTAQGRTVLVRKVPSQIHLVVDFTGWAHGAMPTSAVALHRGHTKTVAYGPFVVLGDVVR